MANLTLRNLPESTLAGLRDRAAANHRSVNAFSAKRAPSRSFSTSYTSAIPPFPSRRTTLYGPIRLPVSSIAFNITARRHYTKLMVKSAKSQFTCPQVEVLFPSPRRRHGNAVWFTDGRTRMAGERPPCGNIDPQYDSKRHEKANHSRSQVLCPRHPADNPFDRTKRRREEKQNRKEHGFCAINGNSHDENISP